MSLLTLSMLVRNEADRFLIDVLGDAARYIDNAVIIDDENARCCVLEHGYFNHASQNMSQSGFARWSVDAASSSTVNFVPWQG